MAKHTRSKSAILFGFGAIIIILLCLVVLLLMLINQNTGQLKQLSTLQRTGAIILEMRQTASQGSLILLRMSLNNDPGYREEQIQAFRKNTEDFMLVRDQYERLPMNRNRRENWDGTLRNIQRSDQAQAKAIDLLQHNRNIEANRQITESVIPAEKKVMQWMSLLLHDNLSEMELLTQQTGKANHRTFIIMSLVGLIVILSVGGIALYVLRTSSRSEHDLILAREEALSANHSKSQFLANMSHEIRTPLTAIIGFADALLDPHQSEQDKIDAIHTISRNGRHLLGLINDILDLSKIESNKLSLEIIEVSPLLLLGEMESLMGSLARDKGLAFNTGITFPMPSRVRTDPTRLKQILLNLLSNAIKFTEHGHISVNCHFDSATHHLCVEVADSGIGMNPKALTKLFQPFMQADASTTRKYGGTGLGLNISKRLAEMLGGAMTVESTEGSGTVFRFHIAAEPASNSEMVFSADAIASQADNYIAADIPALSGRILVAEDSPDIQRLVTLYVRKTGAEVTLAENGQRAVEQALAHDFDLILMDMQMPVMDGLEATAWLRMTGYDKPIVALTANAMQEDREQYRAAGADDFLAKPIALGEFYAMLRNYLKPAIGAAETRHEDSEYQDLVRRFTDGLPAIMKEIDQAVSQGNWDTVRSAAHKLKGMGGSFGYQAITDIASEIEVLAERNQGEALSPHFENLRQQVQKITA